MKEFETQMEHIMTVVSKIGMTNQEALYNVC